THAPPAQRKGSRCPPPSPRSFDNPTDPAAFEAGYADGLVDLARALPGVQRIETSKVWRKEDGSATPAYRMMVLYFADYDSASAAVTTEAAGAFFPAALALATGGVRLVFFDVEESAVL